MSGAHITLHFGLGMWVAMLCTASVLKARWTEGSPLSLLLGRWLALAYLVGVFAAAPNIMYWIGIPETVCSGWWMNVFLLHPLIDRIKPGGMLIGQLLLAGAYLVQYPVLLAALRQTPQSAS